MLPLAALAACMPAHAAALNDLSSIPPVSLTMQPVNLAPAAAELPEPAAGLDEPAPPDGAELVLLPHAAMTTDADTASAAVAHALCFTLTSTGPARYCAWPRISPRLTRRLMPGRVPWEEDRRPSGLLVAESEPDYDGGPGLADRDPGSVHRVLVPSFKASATRRGRPPGTSRAATGSRGPARTKGTPRPCYSASCCSALCCSVLARRGIRGRRSARRPGSRSAWPCRRSR